ncbi:MAG: hypothetical protein HOP31_07000 [Ignavibacteria bacterium]|nr:hypothetical protein [Ignavibacteria bacterium]
MNCTLSVNWLFHIVLWTFGAELGYAGLVFDESLEKFEIIQVKILSYFNQ